MPPARTGPAAVAQHPASQPCGSETSAKFGESCNSLFPRCPDDLADFGGGPQPLSQSGTVGVAVAHPHHTAVAGVDREHRIEDAQRQAHPPIAAPAARPPPPPPPQRSEPGHYWVAWPIPLG